MLEVFQWVAQVGHTQPCDGVQFVVHTIIALGTVMTSLFTAYLAHRRLTADKVATERYHAMLLGLSNVQKEVLKQNGNDHTVGPSGP